MKYIEGKIYWAFDYIRDRFNWDIFQCICKDALDNYFEVIYHSKIGVTDMHFDNLKAANKFVFKTEIKCKRGFIKYVFQEW